MKDLTPDCPDTSQSEAPDLRGLFWFSGFVLVGGFGVGYVLQGFMLAVVNLVLGTVIVAAIIVRVRVLPRRRHSQGLAVRHLESTPRRLATAVGLGVIAGLAGLATLWLTGSEMVVPMAIAVAAFALSGSIVVAFSRRGRRL